MAERINEITYWCVDVSWDAIERGQRDYPEAYWTFYDRYNFEFNPPRYMSQIFPEATIPAS